MNANINLTKNCNMNCSYCFQKNKQQEDLSFENLIKIYNFIISNRKSNQVNITYFGGEPLLNIDVLYEGHQYFKSMCKKNKIDYTINLMTNGTIYNNKVEKLINLDQLIHFNVSWDGLNSSRQQKEFVFNNLKEISKYKNPLTVSLTVDSHYIDNLEENIDYMNEVLPPNASFWINLVTDDRSWTKEKIDIFFQKLLKSLIKHKNELKFNRLTNYQIKDNTEYEKLSKTCDSISFSSNGDIYTCVGFEFSNLPNVKLGNVNTHFDNINFCQQYCTHNFEQEYGCTECEIANMCMGKCHLKYHIFQKEDYENYVCYLYKSYHKTLEYFYSNYKKQ